MKTLRFSLLAIAVSLVAFLSCNKSDLTSSIRNSTANGSLNASASGTTGCGTHDCIFTQGGYGAPNGQPRDFLYANFYKAFPNGFPIGSAGPSKCENGFRVFVSSPEAVTAMLPVGGTPAVLTKNYRDKAPKNVLVGQLIALCLNLDLEPYCPTFDPATMTRMADMIIASGPFQGMTVRQFFVVSGQVLGGCSTQYTPEQVNETATKLNENYPNGGSTGRGFLICP
jgi:hypothetical protein